MKYNFNYRRISLIAIAQQSLSQVNKQSFVSFTVKFARIEYQREREILSSDKQC